MSAQLCREGKDLLDKGSYDQAIAVLTEAIERGDGDIEDAYITRALAYRRLMRFAESLADYDKVIEANPARSEAFYGRGFVHIKLGVYDQAIKDFTRVIELDPGDIGAFINRGNAKRRSGAALASVEDYLEALKLDRADPDARLGLAHAYDQSDQPVRAVEYFSAYLSQDQTNVEALFRRGVNHEKLHHFDKALADFTRALKLDPGHKGALEHKMSTTTAAAEAATADAAAALAETESASVSSINPEHLPEVESLPVRSERFSMRPLEQFFHAGGSMSIYVRDNQGDYHLYVVEKMVKKNVLVSFLSDNIYSTTRRPGEGTVRSSISDAFAACTQHGEPILQTILPYPVQPALLSTARAAWASALNVENDARDFPCTENDVVTCRKELLKEMSLRYLLNDGARYGVRYHLSGVSLSKTDLTTVDCSGISFNDSVMTASIFVESKLAKTSFVACNLSGADFSGAQAENCNFSRADLTNFVSQKGSFKDACFHDTKLRGASFDKCDLRGADFSGAIIESASLKGCPVDERTILPEISGGYPGVIWKGVGRNPFVGKKQDAQECTSLEDLLTSLQAHVDSPRLKKALTMLKKDTFQLYADVSDKLLGGIVKSQTDESLIYACFLNDDGDFYCCTQNLNRCGGLSGNICKHLLVLIIGLAKAGTLEWSQAAVWSRKTSMRSDYPDRDAVSNWFLKYKAAEAGDVDWRPTETIPEDYYAF